MAPLRRVRWKSWSSGALAAGAAAAAHALTPTVVDGYLVDADTLKGYRVWQSQNCAGCHGAEQQGLVGPALIQSLKTMTQPEFERIVREGRVDKKMPAFGLVSQVSENIEQLYAYLKARSEGVITRARVEALK